MGVENIFVNYKAEFCIHDGNQDGTIILKNLCLKFDNVPTVPSAFHCAPIKWMGTDPHNCGNFSEPTNPRDSVDKSPSFSKNHLTSRGKGGLSLQREEFNFLFSTVQNQTMSNSTSFLGHFNQIHLHDHHLFNVPKLPLVSGSHN